MTLAMMKRVTLAMLLGAGSVAAAAQSPVAAIGRDSYKEDAGAALTRHLRTLSDSPRSLTALMGAGASALELGDAQAAATFYARAEEIAPRDGRVKAGLASALVQMEQAPAALKFFAEATSLGVPDAEIARDRGLAYDLSGNPARAQLDYALALRKGDDAEVRRRMALSMAISGDRAGALKMIDGQLRQQDRAAWRTRAFVLALTGDQIEAGKAVAAVMPAQASALRPFLARLPRLAPAERAMAVHFGHFPGDGPVHMANVGEETRTAPAEPVTTASRRRPGANEAVASANLGAARPPATARLVPSAPPPRSVKQPARVSALVGAATPGLAATMKPPLGPPTSLAASTTTSDPAPSGAPVAAPAIARAESSPAPQPAAAVATPAPARPTSFADVAATIAALPAALQPVAPAKLAAAKPSAKTTDKPAAQPKAPTKPVAAKKPEPKAASRHWVQIASAPDGLVASEYRRLKAKHPKLLGGKDGYRAPMGKSNRVLVGPFDSAGDAREFVNELDKVSLMAFGWTSEAGQEIEKLAAK